MNVTFPTAGTSTASLTTADNLGLNDPSPPILTIVVQPVVQITNPKAGSTVKGTVSISATVTGTLGSSNTFTFQVDNTVLKTLAVNGTSASTTWNTKQTGGGKHTLTVTVTGSNITEPAGNTGSASEQVTAR